MRTRHYMNLLVIILIVVLVVPLVTVSLASTTGIAPVSSPVYDYWNPLVGGVMIELAEYTPAPPDPPPIPTGEKSQGPESNWPRCTLGYPVQDSQGNKGYIVAEHCMTVYEYDDVFQPVFPYRVGMIISKSEAHDAAFAKIDPRLRGVSPRVLFIYQDGSWVTKTVKGGVPWGTDLSGHVIYKTGYASKTTTGSFVEYRYRYGPLLRVVLVADSSFATHGDSGAPVFILWPGGVKIIGHVAGGSTIDPNIVVVVHASGPLQALGLSLFTG